MGITKQARTPAAKTVGRHEPMTLTPERVARLARNNPAAKLGNQLVTAGVHVYDGQMPKSQQVGLSLHGGPIDTLCRTKIVKLYVAKGEVRAAELHPK